MMNSKEPYLLINGVFFLILLCIFSYSFFYPVLLHLGWVVPSSCEGLPEVYCRSRGLTRAFSQIIHFNMDKAIGLNKYAISIFTFFVIQSFTRILFSFLYFKMKSTKLIIADAVLSGAYFLYTFFPLTYLYYWIWEK